MEHDAHGLPTLLIAGKQRQRVASVQDAWRIEDEWWRGEPISRTYFELLIDDGRRTTLFLDHTHACWFRQRHA